MTHFFSLLSRSHCFHFFDRIFCFFVRRGWSVSRESRRKEKLRKASWRKRLGEDLKTFSGCVSVRSNDDDDPSSIVSKLSTKQLPATIIRRSRSTALKELLKFDCLRRALRLRAHNGPAINDGPSGVDVDKHTSQVIGLSIMAKVHMPLNIRNYIQQSFTRKCSIKIFTFFSSPRSLTQSRDFLFTHRRTKINWWRRSKMIFLAFKIGDKLCKFVLRTESIGD